MQGLVHIGLGHGNIIFEAARHRFIDIVNDTIVNLYKGFLKGLLDGEDERDPQQQAERYLTCFENILQFYRSDSPGVSESRPTV